MIGDFGRSALSLMLAARHGRRAPSSTGRTPTSASPGTCCRAGRWRCWRWRCSLPVAAAACARARRRRPQPAAGRAARSAGRRCARCPFALALLAVYAARVHRGDPEPGVPVRPRSGGPRDRRGSIGVVLSLAACSGPRPSCCGRCWRRPPPLAELAGAGGARPAPPRAGLGALVRQPLPLPAASRSGCRPGSRRRPAGRCRAGSPTAGLVALGTIPRCWPRSRRSAGRFDAGLGVVWDLLFMFTGGPAPRLAGPAGLPARGLRPGADRRGRATRLDERRRAAQPRGAGRARPPARGAASRVEAEEGAPRRAAGRRAARAQGAGAPRARASAVPPPDRRPSRRSLRPPDQPGDGPAHVVEAAGVDLGAVAGRGSTRPRPGRTRPT